MDEETVERFPEIFKAKIIYLKYTSYERWLKRILEAG
jgi:hypothetical protein